MPPRTHKEVTDLINRQYIFSGFNILIYAQNYILKFATSTDQSALKETNREQIYKLYEYALQLEPKPDREELTFAQQQLVNRARSFVTMKMKRRQNLRDQKKEGKNLKKLRKLLSDQLMSGQQAIGQGFEIEDDEDDDEEEAAEELKQKKAKANKGAKSKKSAAKVSKIIGEVEEENDLAEDDEEDDEADWVPMKTLKKLRQKQEHLKRAVDYDDPDLEDDDDDEDQVLHVGKASKKKKKKARKRKAGSQGENESKGSDGAKEPAAKRVHFDLSQNKVTEFFKHGKVAQRVLE